MIVVVNKPIHYPWKPGKDKMVNRALGQPYDTAEERDTLEACFLQDDLVKEIMWSEDEFFKKYGRI